MERECLDKKHHLIRGSIVLPGKNHDFVFSHPSPIPPFWMSNTFLSCVIRTRIYNLGHGGEPSPGETPVTEAAAERSLLPPEAPACEETWEGWSPQNNCPPLVSKCASTFISNSFFRCCRSWNTCNATTNGWSRLWNLGSSRRRAGCPRSNAAKPRPGWPSLRRASASTRRSAPAKRGTGSNRWEAPTTLSSFPASPPPPLSFVLLQFLSQEEKRQKTERQLQQQKHENQMRELIGQCEGNIRELQQLQVS